MDDPYWNERELSYLRPSRTRRHLFEERFNLAMSRIWKEGGTSCLSKIRV